MTTRICIRDGCTAEVVGRSDKVYCSVACRRTAAYDRDRVVHAPRVCPSCLKDFVPTDGHQIYCSTFCGKVCWDRNKSITKHGITMDEYERLWSLQQGRCRCCGGAAPDERRMNIDHDHSHCPGTNACRDCIRGLVCTPCNVRISVFERKLYWALYERYLDGPNGIDALLRHLSHEQIGLSI